MSKIIDGKKIAKEIETELTSQVSLMSVPPKLSVVQIGDDPASASYIKAKANAASRVGIKLTHHHLSKDCLLYTSPSPRDLRLSRMPSSA